MAATKRTRLKGEERRALILEAARRVFLESGFAGARTRRIAEEAGITEALLYRFFPSKLAIYEAAVIQPLEEFVAAMLAATGEIEASRDDREGGLRRINEMLFHFMRESAPFLAVVLLSELNEGRRFYRNDFHPVLSKPINDVVKEMSDKVQFRQEIGGLLGRILLAWFLILGMRRVTLLKVFQMPALVILPLTYFTLFRQGGEAFLWSYFICGLLTVAQFSYFGEYLPKAFPLHLRGTGGSFATNVGGRMFGTSMAFVTTNLVAPMLARNGPLLPAHVAQAAGLVATTVAVIGFLIGFLLPEPPQEGIKD